MIKAVLFDLDNTLIDFVKMKLECSKESVKAMIKAGLEMDEETAYNKLLELYYETSLEDHLIFQHFLKKNTGKVDYKILSAAIVAYKKIVNGLLIPYEGVYDTLKKLKSKGLILGVVTDARKLNAWIRLTSAGLSNYFEIVLTLGDSKYKKPHKRPFIKAARQLKLKPEEIIFVGDNPQRDIKGAKKVGMKTAFAQYGFSFKEKTNNEDEKPDYILNEFNDLLKII
ncbi:MAG: TIGR02253 family HAD-type hydrolase [Candidatus Nanoarchaeia archaeon]|nr:TIGR02253 family HAD-type hydrolase [Candidatus Nanoarchaeia archaeon]